MPKTTTVYVAASSKELERARAAMERVRQHPTLTLAFDWTMGFGELAIPWSQIARTELAAIRRSDLFWLLGPGERRTDAWVEVGTALGLRIPVYASGHLPDESLFATLLRTFETDDDAIVGLLEFAGRR
ncbi:MAG: hypothetical protein AAGE52_30355 [Myxococcota bacterium]